MTSKSKPVNTLKLPDYTQIKIFGDATRSMVYLPDFLAYVKDHILDENSICQIVKEEVEEQLKNFEGGAVDLDPDKQKLTTQLPQAQDSVETVGEALVYLDNGLLSVKEFSSNSHNYLQEQIINLKTDTYNGLESVSKDVQHATTVANNAYSLASNNDSRVAKLSEDLVKVSNVANNANNTCEILRDNIDNNTQLIIEDRERMKGIEDDCSTNFSELKQDTARLTLDKLEAKIVGKGDITFPRNTYVNGSSYQTHDIIVPNAKTYHFALVNPMNTNDGTDQLQYTANIVKDGIVTIYANNNFDVGVMIATEIRVVVLEI